MNIEMAEDAVPGSNQQERLANLGLSPEFKAAITAKAFSPSIGEQDLAAIFKRVGDLSVGVLQGDIRPLEAMLISQAICLDSIFNRLAIQAQANIGKYPKAVETYLRLALKAQNQCRTTAETLAAIKSPRQHITQNNVAGAMQINIEMEGSHVDRRAEGKDAASNPAMEALGEVHGAKDGSWEGSIKGKLPETRDVFS
jgi:hypothetical protein